MLAQAIPKFPFQALADGAGEAQACLPEELWGGGGGREDGHQGPGEHQHSDGGRGEAGEGRHRAVQQGHALQGRGEL